MSILRNMRVGRLEEKETMNLHLSQHRIIVDHKSKPLIAKPTENGNFEG
jgi:hypothetical protein